MIGIPSVRFVERFNRAATQLDRSVRLEKGKPVVQPSSEQVQRVLRAIESGRLELARKSFEYHQRISYRAPLERLNQTERRAVELFATVVKPILEQIEARQWDPNALRLAEWMKTHGDFYSRILFERFHRDTGAGFPFVGHPDLSLFPFFPDLPPVSGMIDPSISLQEIAALSATRPPDDELFRPTTVLEKHGGGIVAFPLPLHPAFSDDHRRLTASLRMIAALDLDGAINPSLKDQLLKWARFFETGSAVDEALAAQATIDAGEGGGLLRVHIGPSESYWEDAMKFPYLLQVGVRDLGLTRRLAENREIFLQMEASLEEIPNYQPRELSTRGGFADPIYQAVVAGFISTYPFGEPAGNNFPNYPYHGVEGSNRFILLEVMAAGAEQKKLALSRLLAEDVSGWDALENLIEHALWHESGHLIGPQRGHLTPSQQRMGSIFGSHWGSADEPKSDLTFIEGVGRRLSAGQLSPEKVRDLLRAQLARLFSTLYKGKEKFNSGALADHHYGQMLQVGYYFRRGAITLQGGRFHIDYNRLLEASHELWKKIIAYQAAGDLKGFLEFSGEMVSCIPEDADRMILEANKDIKEILVERYLG